MSAYFQPSRADGRSDARVVYDLVHGAAPGEVFTYDQLLGALQSGLSLPVRRERVYRSVTAASRLLLREDKRSLTVVRGTGYKVLRADEHLPVAIQKKSRAETQMKNGIALLKSVRWDELDPIHRMLHQGQLLIMDGVYQAVRATDRRVARHDEALRSMDSNVARQQELLNQMRQRLDQLEAARTNVSA